MTGKIQIDKKVSNYLKDWLLDTGDVVNLVILFKVDFNIDAVPGLVLVLLLLLLLLVLFSFWFFGEVWTAFFGEGILGFANWATKLNKTLTLRHENPDFTQKIISDKLTAPLL